MYNYTRSGYGHVSMGAFERVVKYQAPRTWLYRYYLQSTKSTAALKKNPMHTGYITLNLWGVYLLKTYKLFCTSSQNLKCAVRKF